MAASATKRGHQLATILETERNLHDALPGAVTPASSAVGPQGIFELFGIAPSYSYYQVASLAGKKTLETLETW